MVQLTTFRTLGYVLAVLFIASSVTSVINGITIAIGGRSMLHRDSGLNANQYATAKIVAGVLGVILYVVFAIGIKKKSPLIVTVVGIITIIMNCLGLVAIGIAVIAIIMLAATHEAPSVPNQGVLIGIVIIVSLLMIAIFIVQLWIINGVKRYVEWKRGTSNQEKV